MCVRERQNETPRERQKGGEGEERGKGSGRRQGGEGGKTGEEVGERGGVSATT